MSSISTIHLVDAFTSHPFGGNPAAVALCDSYPDDTFLQAIAQELNLSETAFVCIGFDRGVCQITGLASYRHQCRCNTIRRINTVCQETQQTKLLRWI
jgi:hypothetical protein